MKLGFYYHIPIFKKEEQIFTPSFLGVFINSLAENVSELYLFFHEAKKEHERAGCDYSLLNTNIHFINLGQKTIGWNRVIFHKKILKYKLKEFSHLDVFLLRSPSPLVPFFSKYIPNEKIWFMIVGDLNKTLRNNDEFKFRDFLINRFVKYQIKIFNRQISQTKVLVNSHELFLTYKSMAPKIFEIRTTTLQKSDFYQRINTCESNEINLLFTGRIDLAKGLLELIEATALLKHEGISIQCHIVGWEQGNEKKVEEFLISKAHDLGIGGNIFFHGKKSVGEELNSFYRMADIYVLPSYHEGFPRTIWEAMANSLPVITTPVGSIPFYLSENVNVVFVEPKNSLDLKNGILNLINSEEMRKTLIVNGFELSQDNTLDVQTKKLLEIIKNE